jgi:3-dehydroquinate dehydratase-1
MAQLVSSKNLLMSSRPLVVGVISDAEVMHDFVSQSAEMQQTTCDVVELRLDLIGLPAAELRAAASGVVLPVLLTARHPAEGGQGAESGEARAAMIEPLLDIAALVDIELRSVNDMRGLLAKARGMGVSVLGSFHDFQATPADDVLRGAVTFAENAGLDAVKMAAYVNSVEDLFRLGRLVGEPKRLRLSAMGMGPWGRVSRLLLAKCGSLLNYGYLGESNAPGQWPARQLKELLNEL